MCSVDAKILAPMCPKFLRRPQRSLFFSKFVFNMWNGRFATFRTTQQENSCRATKRCKKSRRPKRVLDQENEKTRICTATISLAPIVSMSKRTTHPTTTTKQNTSISPLRSQTCRISQRAARAPRCRLANVNRLELRTALRRSSMRVF